eukprot:1028126_1
MSDTEMLAKEVSKSDNNDVSQLTSIQSIGPAIGWIAVAVAWCVQGGYGTPYLLELGLKTSTVNYVWLAGPISGMIVQPLVGSLSDKTKQRKPFIITGAIAVFLSMIMFSNAKWLKYIDKIYAMIVGITMFWINDFCINVLMVPLRALSADTIPSKHQINAVSWIAISGGIGNFIAFGFGSVISNVPILYFIAAIIVLSSSFIAVKVVKNVPPVQAQTDTHIHSSTYQLLRQGITNIIGGIVRCPLFIWKLMLSQFLMFCSCYPIWIYGTHFFGENLMNGYVDDENEGTHQYKLYQQGVKYGNLANCIKGIVRIVCAYLLPKLLNGTNHRGIKLYWSVSYVAFGAFMCATPWIKSIPLFIMCQGLIEGVAVTSLHTFGWMFTSIYAIQFEPSNAGLILSIFNLCQCFPQIFMSLISGVIIERFDHNVAPMLFIGGVFGVLAGFAVCCAETEYQGVSYSPLKEMNDDNEIEIEMGIDLNNCNDIVDCINDN